MEVRQLMAFVLAKKLLERLATDGLLARVTGDESGLTQKIGVAAQRGFETEAKVRFVAFGKPAILPIRTILGQKIWFLTFRRSLRGEMGLSLVGFSVAYVCLPAFVGSCMQIAVKACLAPETASSKKSSTKVCKAHRETICLLKP